MRLNVPFFPNTKDDMHCFQASVRMALKYFEPEKDYSWGKLDRLSAKKEGLWTWPTAAIINLLKMGYDVFILEDWDYQAFINRGEAYLIEKYGAKAATEQIENSDIPQERRLIKEFIKRRCFKHGIPTIDDIKRLLKKGHLVCCNVNSRTLDNRQGYVGHFIIIVGFDDKSLWVHDPGLPPQKDRRVSYQQFEKAWGYPTNDMKNILAIKR